MFKKDGTVTAGNASTLNDGACAMILMSAEKAAALGCTPLARVRGFADAATLPIDFPIAPALAVPKALEWAGVSKDDVRLQNPQISDPRTVTVGPGLNGFRGSQPQI